MLMPFKEETTPQSLYHDVLAGLPGWNVTRADEDLSKPEIVCKICANIQKSRAIIADLSGSNPNVFLELGLAWGVGKPYILLTQDRGELPFDTKTFHVIKYERDSARSTEIVNKEALQKEILGVLNKIPEPLQSGFATTRETKLYKDVMKAKSDATAFWRRIGGRWKIIQVGKTGDKIGVSLLHVYPDSKRIDMVAQEAEISKRAVRMYANGERGNHSQYLNVHRGNASLTDDGLYWVIEKVIPRIMSER